MKPTLELHASAPCSAKQNVADFLAIKAPTIDDLRNLGRKLDRDEVPKTPRRFRHAAELIYTMLLQTEITDYAYYGIRALAVGDAPWFMGFQFYDTPKKSIPTDAAECPYCRSFVHGDRCNSCGAPRSKG